MKPLKLLRILIAAMVVMVGERTVARPVPAAAPTFSKDVAPVFYKHCVTCHRPGEAAPMPLLTFAQARPWAKSIRERVASGAMPPWHADAPAGTFRNERVLTAAERTAILEWVDGGAVEGDPKDLPPAPQFAEGWRIGTPDAVVSMPRSFDVPARGEVDYQYFRAPTNFSEDKWVQAIEIRPEARAAVHHVVIYSREPNPGRRTRVFRGVSERGSSTNLLNDPDDGGEGTEGYGDLLATTAPGTSPLVFAQGQALRMKAGSTLTFQVHYTTNGTAAKDRTVVGFVFAKEPPQQEVLNNAFYNFNFRIPAGAPNHRVDSAVQFVRDAQLLALFPHTHLRGKSWEYRLVYPDGRSEVILSAPRYDFNWQSYYEFARPIAVPRGARLEASAYYDNSANNRSNPDPKANVGWGDQTWDEMQYTGITLVID